MLRAGERFDSHSFSEGWYPGAEGYYKFVLGAGAIKNHDKLIDPIVRVRLSNLFSLAMLIFEFVNNCIVY